MGFAVWWLIGIVGAYLAWLFWVLEFEDYRCPTPRALVGMLLGGAVMGPFTFVLAATWGAPLVIPKALPRWFVRPICGKDRRGH